MQFLSLIQIRYFSSDIIFTVNEYNYNGNNSYYHYYWHYVFLYHFCYRVQSHYKIATFGQFVAVAVSKGNIQILSLSDLKPIYLHKSSELSGKLNLFLLLLTTKSFGKYFVHVVNWFYTSFQVVSTSVCYFLHIYLFIYVFIHSALLNSLNDTLTDLFTPSHLSYLFNRW